MKSANTVEKDILDRSGKMGLKAATKEVFDSDGYEKGSANQGQAVGPDPARTARRANQGLVEGPCPARTALHHSTSDRLVLRVHTPSGRSVMINSYVQRSRTLSLSERSELKLRATRPLTSVMVTRGLAASAWRTRLLPASRHRFIHMVDSQVIFKWRNAVLRR
jgi:hypothetical protein